jgi:hypothetical protein
MLPIRLTPNSYSHKRDGSMVIEWGSFMISLRELEELTIGRESKFLKLNFVL